MVMMQRGTTLIELLVVVAIIAILAGIAVPNFLEAQTRTKISRVTMDMQSLKAGVRGYYSDHFVYPANHDSVDGFLAGPKADKADVKTEEQPIEPEIDPAPENTTGSEKLSEDYFSGVFRYEKGDLGMIAPTGRDPEHVTQFLDHSYSALFVLTTPVAYIAGTIPKDTFNARYTGSPSELLYINASEIIQYDDPRWIPERRFLLISSGPSVKFEFPRTTDHHVGPFFVYDPTNGTVSDGNLFVTGSDLSGRQLIAP